MLALLKSDARKIPLADESVQCVVTSPPYWGLRKYAGEQELVWSGRQDCGHEWASERYYTEQTAAIGSAEAFSKAGENNKARLKAGRWRETSTCRECGAWRGAYGLEPTVEMYVQHTVEILREIRRVLRDDGVVFWNIGDSYCGYWGDKKALAEGRPSQADTQWTHGFSMNSRPKFDSFRHEGIKPKDLCLIPFRVALAAQADGWWVRSDIIWAKPNPMPESVTDRPTDSYEHILMLTKNARYYWDGDAVAEPFNYPERRYNPDTSKHKTLGVKESGNRSTAGLHDGREQYGDPTKGRNLRNIWTFSTKPYPEAHFATFPEELPKRCILAATSAKGACAKCGKPWERLVKATGGTIGRSWHDHQDDIGKGQSVARLGNGEHEYERETIGWQRGCECGIEETVPCLILDPFAGSGTVGKVAIALGRRAIICDLAYQDLASKRTAAIQRPLLEAGL